MTSIHQYRQVIWKEVRELRWFGLAGLVLLVLFPTIRLGIWLATHDGSLVYGSNEVRMSPPYAGHVFLLGAIYAALVALAAAGRDLRYGIAAPWRQTPIRPFTFLTIKWFVGLGIVLLPVVLAALLHLASGVMFDPEIKLLGANSGWSIRDGLQLLNSHLFLLIAAYAIAFACAAILRPLMSAMIVAGMGIGILYYLPLLVPALDFANIFTVMREPPMWVFADRESVRYFSGASKPIEMFGYWVVLPKMVGPFVLTMLGVTCVVAAVALRYAVRGRSVMMSPEGVAWTFGTVFLGLFSLAAVQVGNNIEPLDVLDVPDGEYQFINELHIRDSRALVALVGHRNCDTRTHPMRLLQMDQLNEADLAQRSGAIDVPARSHRSDTSNHLMWSADRPNIVFALDRRGSYDKQEKWQLRLLALRSYRINEDGSCHSLSNVNLTRLFDGVAEQGDSHHVKAVLRGDMIYVLRNRSKKGTMSHLLVFDARDPQALKLAKRHEIDQQFFRHFWASSSSSSGTMRLPNIPGLSQEARFDLLWNLGWRSRSRITDGKHIVDWDRKRGTTIYQRNEQTDDKWHYQRVGQRSLTALERSMLGDVMDAKLADGLLYLLTGHGHTNLFVFDLRDPTRPRKIGHFYPAGDDPISMALDGDRLYLSGKKIHVLDHAAMLTR